MHLNQLHTWETWKVNLRRCYFFFSKVQFRLKRSQIYLGLFFTPSKNGFTATYALGRLLKISVSCRTHYLKLVSDILEMH